VGLPGGVPPGRRGCVAFERRELNWPSWWPYEVLAEVVTCSGA